MAGQAALGQGEPRAGPGTSPVRCWLGAKRYRQGSAIDSEWDRRGWLCPGLLAVTDPKCLVRLEHHRRGYLIQWHPCNQVVPGVGYYQVQILHCQPLGLGADEAALYRRRVVEIKHGRICMIAFLGMTVGPNDVRRAATLTPALCSSTASARAADAFRHPPSPLWVSMPDAPLAACLRS